MGWDVKPKRGKPVPVVLSKKDRRKLAREIAALGPESSPAATRVGVGGGVLARSGGYRFRRQLIPLGWALAVMAAGPGINHAHDQRAGVVAGLGGGLAVYLVTRHLKGRSRWLGTAMALLTAIWLPVLSYTGLARPWPALFAVSWAVLQASWSHHFRWRGRPAPSPQSDEQIFARLAEKNKWAARLGGCEQLPHGGRRWQIVLDGSNTHIGALLAQPRSIAAAYSRAVTEAYIEPSPDGIEDRGRLTLLRSGTLDVVREWDGGGIDPATGLAVVGFFPDGEPVHERYFVPMNGAVHAIFSGTPGSGKTGMLDLSLCIAAKSPGLVAPVVLDPQQGQALPAWPGYVPYARGAEQCLLYLEALYSAMMARSAALGRAEWVNDQGRKRRGMGFFDPILTGLPVIEVILDEAPAFLKLPDTVVTPAGKFRIGERAAWLLGEIGKLGRKAGFRICLCVQYPSLSELGDTGSLRSVLTGGNVFALRSGDNQSGTMIGAKADPRALPRYFRDGKPTVGLGYASGPDDRPSTPMRAVWVRDPAHVAETVPVTQPDAQVMAYLGRATVQDPLPHLAATPAEAEPPGRTCADAIEQVMREKGPSLPREVIAAEAAKLGKQWGRADGWTIRAVHDALMALVAGGKMTRETRGFYAVAGGNAGTGGRGA